jgi:hypothetical protein
MKWIVDNLHHLMVALSLVVSASAAFLGLRARRNKRVGATPSKDRFLVLGAFVLALLSCFILGIAVLHISS